jgi:maleylacetoacetate isomerase
VKLYIDARSTASLRVTTYATFKGIKMEQVRVGLLAGKHLTAEYRAFNPSASVPALELDDGTVLTQSLVILDWLEASYPQPPALPPERLAQAQVRSLCGLVASEIAPLANMRVRQKIASMNAGNEVAARTWCREWTEEGLRSLAGWVERNGGQFGFGDSLTFADFFLAPTFLNAELWGTDVTTWPVLDRVWQNLLAHPAFAAVAKFRLLQQNKAA